MLKRQKLTKKLLSILISSTLAVGILPGMSVFAQTETPSSNEIVQSSNEKKSQGELEVAEYTLPSNGEDIADKKLKYFIGTEAFTVTSGTGGLNNNHQGCKMLFDGRYGGNYKYFRPSLENGKIETEFEAKVPFIPKKYFLMTGEDTYGWHRNPKSWKIYAKEESDDKWTTIAEVVNDEKMKDVNDQVYEFDFDNGDNKKYKYFKFEISAIEEAGFQLAELFMAGTLIPSSGDDAGDDLKYYVGFENATGDQGITNADVEADKLVDGNYNASTATAKYKYCVAPGETNDGVVAEFNYSEAFVPKKYYLMTAEDASSHGGRNPKSWKISAKENENDDWTPIAEVSNDTTIGHYNNTIYKFDFDNKDNKKYKYFQFKVSKVEDANDGFQLNELFMAGSDNPIDLGYPYATSVTDSSVKLTVDCDLDGVSYQWQKSGVHKEEKDATDFANIAGATAAEYIFKGSDLVDGAWYRCKVGSSYSKAVQIIYPGSDWYNSQDGFGRLWTCPHKYYGNWNNSYYVSNGTAAYTVDVEGSSYSKVFDVVGKYEKNGKTYMLQTTYSGYGWSMVSSRESDPGVQSRYDVDQSAPDKLKISFDEAKPVMIRLEATLDNGGSFAIFSDSQLGNENTSGAYADYAALIAGLNGNKGMKQLTMIGAASETEAAKEDPAFAVQVVEDPVFWVGPYYLDLYAFNTDDWGCTISDVYAKGRGDTKGAIKAESIDSGTSICWLDMEPGQTVGFKYAVGDASSTGAVSSEIDYTNEKLKGLKPGEEYTVEDEDGNDETFKADSEGAISIKDDYFGQTIVLKHDKDDPQEITLAARPEAKAPILADQTEVFESPVYVKDQQTAVTEDSITLTIEDSAMLNQMYAIFRGDDQLEDWAYPSGEGTLGYTGLRENTDYTIRAYIPATDMTPKSKEAKTEVSTAASITVTEPEKKTVNYSGNPRTFEVKTSGGSNTEVAYSTDYAEKYSETVPSFTEGGRYTVFYRVTADNSVPRYGSFDVTIRPRVQFFANGGTLDSSTPEDAFYVDYEDTINAEYFAEPIYSSSTRFFAGWYTSDKFSVRWNKDTPVRENLTLYARWVQKLFGISGTAAKDAIGVQLFQGNKAVSEYIELDVSDKSFEFTKIPDGEYDLVVSMKDDRTITKLVRLKDSDIQDLEVAAAEENISSVVSVADVTPDIVVGNLDLEAADKDKYWNETYERNNMRVELSLKAGSQHDWTGIDEDGAAHLSIFEKALWDEQTEIAAAAKENDDKVIEFIGLDAGQAAMKYGASAENARSAAPTETNNVIEIIIPYDTDDVEGLSIYRYHDTEVSKFTELDERPTADLQDGTFYVEGADTENSRGGYIAVYTSGFSTYAIAGELPKKQKAPKPGIPQLKQRTKNSITIVAEEGLEYSIDGGETWQTGGEFEGLEEAKEYSIIARRPETDEYLESDPSDALKVSTNSGETVTNTEVIDSEDLGKGKIITETNIDESLPAVSFENLTTSLAKALLTEEELDRVGKGEYLWLYMDVKAAEGFIGDSDKQSMEALAKSFASDGTIGKYLEISLYKKIGNDEAIKITELGSERIRLNVSVPTELVAGSGVSRTFMLAQIHNGQARILTRSKQISLTAELDGFSIFAIGYSDRLDDYLVVKQRVYGYKYFGKYGEAGYKYKYKVDNKAQRKIVSTSRGMIKAKKPGEATVTLYRKKKGSSWEKIEEHTFYVLKPEIAKKQANLAVGATAEAKSYITNEMYVEPTYYISSKPEVISVDYNTGKMTAKKAGKATIYIIYDNGIGAARYKTKVKVS